MGRFPITSSDAEISPDRVFGTLFACTGLASLGLLPIVGLLVGLAMLKAPPVLVTAIVAFIIWPLLYLANTIFGPAIMVDNEFSSISVFTGGAAIALVTIAVAAIIVYVSFLGILRGKDI